MAEIRVKAILENLPQVLALVEGVLEQNECPLKLQMQMDIAVEELFVNIVNYAYTEGEGDAVIRMEILDDPKRAGITLIDEGMEFNPLDRPDPDVTLSVEQRKIGGLGIYLARKNTDQLTYERRDGRNILTIEKHLPEA